MRTMPSAQLGLFCLCGLALTLPPIDRAQAKNFDLVVTFTGQSNGGSPYGGLIKDAGNLYGTTAVGGVGYGTVFKIEPGGTETVLYSFQGGQNQDGANPYAGVVGDGKGNFYGVTEAGGSEGCEFGEGCGTVFKLASDGTETVLHIFSAGKTTANILMAGWSRTVREIFLEPHWMAAPPRWALSTKFRPMEKKRSSITFSEATAQIHSLG